MCRRNLSARPSKYSDYLSLRQNYSDLVPNCFSCVDFSAFFPISSVADCPAGAVWHGYTFLGFNEPFICRLVQQLVDDIGSAGTFRLHPSLQLCRLFAAKVHWTV